MMLVDELLEALKDQLKNSIVVVRVSEYDICRTVKLSREKLRFHNNGSIGEVGSYEQSDGDSTVLDAVVLEIDEA